jgi:transcriptional regulator GlxA family with amidase domain
MVGTVSLSLHTLFYKIDSMNKKTIGILCFDDVVALDIVGPAETFNFSSVGNDNSLYHYNVTLIGLNKNIITSESGIKFEPSATIYDDLKIDTLIIPGGAGLRKESTKRQFEKWIITNSNDIRRIATVCTGVFGLLDTGLLSGKEITTHWRFADEISRNYTDIKMNSNAIFIKDGNIYTSAGATSGIDLSLALIEEDNGSKNALLTARELVVYSKRDGGQNQYSNPLRFQTSSSDKFSSIITWIHHNYHLDLSLSDLADKASLCTRQFSRRFKKETGSSPIRFLQSVRLDEACNRLTSSSETIETISKSIGFTSADIFRRAFFNKFGISPRSYRDRFGKTINCTGE